MTENLRKCSKNNKSERKKRSITKEYVSNTPAFPFQFQVFVFVFVFIPVQKAIGKKEKKEKKKK